MDRADHRHQMDQCYYYQLNLGGRFWGLDVYTDFGRFLLTRIAPSGFAIIFTSPCCEADLAAEYPGTRVPEGDYNGLFRCSSCGAEADSTNTPDSWSSYHPAFTLESSLASYFDTWNLAGPLEAELLAWACAAVLKSLEPIVAAQGGE